MCAYLVQMRAISRVRLYRIIVDPWLLIGERSCQFLGWVTIMMQAISSVCFPNAALFCIFSRLYASQ